MKKISRIRYSFLIMFIVSVLLVSAYSVNLSDPTVISSELEPESESCYEITEFNLKEDSNNCKEKLDPLIEISQIPQVETVTGEDEITYYIELTEDEIYDLATLVFLEAGGESYECQKAVASVVINRVTTSGKSLYDIIYEKNQFTPANLIECREPTESTMNAVIEVCTNGPTIPEYVTYFRADYYHNFSEYLEDYINIDSTYFSYDVNLKTKLENS